MYSLFFDGSCTPNPGFSGGTGFVIKDSDNKVIHSESHPFSGARITNNEMEYTALILGCSFCLQKGYMNVRVFGDSKLVISQVTGKWAVKSPALLKYYKVIKILEAEFHRIEFHHICRELNSEADALSDIR